MLMNQPTGGRRFLLSLISASLLFFGGGAQTKCPRRDSPTNKQGTDVTQIFAEAEWYQARPEPEKQWRGVLRKRDAPLGPATRGALSFTLVTADKSLPVYAANVEQRLGPFVGRQVLVSGKLVDLSQEGFGEELWIASIQAMGPSSK